MHFTSRTFKFNGSHPNQRGALFLQDAALRVKKRYEKSKPTPHQGHTFTWRSYLRNLTSLERELQNTHRHMVRTKSTPCHADVRPPKFVVYITRNPVTFAIHRRREFYLLDQKARETRQQAEYKRHVHTPPVQYTTTITTKNTFNYRHH